ncbi:2OG-Fe(II) oxygenase [Pseudomonas sp. NPDC087612]|uniref:2OG-Fe(II) oxygenase n=1 Tax=unclassified Pseudomonas TaxID=196821 RepID=UPI0015A6DDB5|nr:MULTISPECIES: 2OG-Fe(II) oxygenase [unclassified Pseudomonas]QVM95611.1 2OG-Fe(II) oxygenase [Pseudomonas sp. SORT22]UVM57158.1 2OG-Fe(II) oxygenase [Pseudomonas sp. B21-012]
MDTCFGEKDVQVVDDFVTVDEQCKVVQQLKGAIWRYGWPVNTATHSRPCWHTFIAGAGRQKFLCAEDELKSSDAWSFLFPFWARVKQQYMQDATLIGVYANGQTFAQESPIHRDNQPGEEGQTVLMFCNEFWPTSWGGELVFYDHPKNDIIKAVLPKPGRIVVFNGSVPHNARSPALSCDQLRMTLAFKTIIKG